MKFKLFGYQGAVAVAVTICALSASAEAPTAAICAVQQAVACGAFETCERALPAAVNLPALMRVDVDAGVIESRNENGDIRTSKIASSSTEGEALLLQGVDGGLLPRRVLFGAPAFVLVFVAEPEVPVRRE